MVAGSDFPDELAWILRRGSYVRPREYLIDLLLVDLPTEARGYFQDQIFLSEDIILILQDLGCCHPYNALVMHHRSEHIWRVLLDAIVDFGSQRRLPQVLDVGRHWATAARAGEHVRIGVGEVFADQRVPWIADHHDFRALDKQGDVRPRQRHVAKASIEVTWAKYHGQGGIRLPLPREKVGVEQCRTNVNCADTVLEGKRRADVVEDRAATLAHG